MFVFLDFVIKHETLYNILNNISVVFLCVTKSLFAAVRKNMFEKWGATEFIGKNTRPTPKHASISVMVWDHVAAYNFQQFLEASHIC